MEQQLQRCRENSEIWSEFDSNACVHISPSVEEAVGFIDNNIGSSENVDILVTGSLHLIGALLTVIST
jgi:folylpolyglutamate synthase